MQQQLLAQAARKALLMPPPFQISPFFSFLLRASGLASRAGRGRRAALCLAALGAVLSGGGCGDERAQEAGPSQQSQDAETESTRLQKPGAWLGKEDRTPPEQWLLAREGGAAPAAGDPALAALRSLLSRASQRFGEKPRMIANRAVQLETMLGEKGVREGARDLIADLLSVADQRGRAEGFGALCQHYYNLRTQGLDRAGALASLRQQYGAGPSGHGGEGSSGGR